MANTSPIVNFKDGATGELRSIQRLTGELLGHLAAIDGLPISLEELNRARRCLDEAEWRLRRQIKRAGLSATKGQEDI